MQSSRVRAASLAAALCMTTSALAACGSGSSAGLGPGAEPMAGVGTLPPALGTFGPGEPGEPGVTTPAAGASAVDATNGETVAERAAGNRILLIGDSIMSSISRRYGDQACELLVPQGWRVAVEAEKSRPVGFGLQVLDRLLDDGWDAFVILLGNNYGRNDAAYREQLEEMLDRIGAAPVVLLTVTEFRPVQREVNDVIRDVAAARPNVMLLDWAAVTEQQRSLLGADGLHLTEKGRDALGALIAEVAGTIDGEGECLRSGFTDDSAPDPDPEPDAEPDERVVPRTTVRRSQPATSSPTTTPPATSPRSSVPSSSPSSSGPSASTPSTASTPTSPPSTRPPTSPPTSDAPSEPVVSSPILGQ